MINKIKEWANKPLPETICRIMAGCPVCKINWWIIGGIGVFIFIAWGYRYVLYG